jgi:hypothetical protein
MRHRSFYFETRRYFFLDKKNFPFSPLEINIIYTMSLVENASDQRLSGLDTIFLKCEHPRRLMTVTFIWVFDHRLDSKPVFEALDKMCQDYPRFAKVPRNESFFKTAAWTMPLGWCPEDNVVLNTLEEPTRKALQNYCAKQVVKNLD